MIPAFVDSLQKTNRNRVQFGLEVASMAGVGGSLEMTSSVVGRRSVFDNSKY